MKGMGVQSHHRNGTSESWESPAACLGTSSDVYHSQVPFVVPHFYLAYAQTWKISLSAFLFCLYMLSMCPPYCWEAMMSIPISSLQLSFSSSIIAIVSYIRLVYKLLKQSSLYLSPFWVLPEFPTSLLRKGNRRGWEPPRLLIPASHNPG